jgi:hypothetical protein
MTLVKGKTGALVFDMMPVPTGWPGFGGYVL